MSLTYDEMTLGPDAYSSGSSRATITYTRVYRKGGQYAHFRELAIMTGCQTQEQDDDIWYGTGSQAEYEHAAAKPLCSRCFRAREGGGQDPTARDHRLGSAHGVEMT